MLTGVFRILLRVTWRCDFVLYFRLIIDEFDVGDLLLRRRRNEEEERQNEEASHECNVQQVTSACRFRHRHHVFGIYASALQQGGMVVGVTNSKCDEREEQTKNDQGSGASHVHL